jgi:LysM repeat protein
VPGAKTFCAAGNTQHTTTQGQTVVDILALYNVSYAALAAANPAVSLGQLGTGQALCIPPTGSRGICGVNGIAPHVIQKDETLTTIADLYKTTVSAILMANPNLAPADFVTGRIICLPKA